MDNATLTLVVLAFVAFFFVTELIPLAMSAMLGAIAVGVLGIIPINQVFSGLSNSTVTLFGAMFVIGAAMFHTGLAQKIGITVVKFTGTGLTMAADKFLNLQTILIICLGLVAFAGGTWAGIVVGKLMYYTSGGKINPLIGSAGVSAVPMAARVSQVVGQKANPANFLLMHAMGPNVSGVIGTAVAAGTMLAMLGGGK